MWTKMAQNETISANFDKYKRELDSSHRMQREQDEMIQSQKE